MQYEAIIHTDNKKYVNGDWYIYRNLAAEFDLEPNEEYRVILRFDPESEGPGNYRVAPDDCGDLCFLDFKDEYGEIDYLCLPGLKDIFGDKFEVPAEETRVQIILEKL